MRVVVRLLVGVLVLAGFVSVGVALTPVELMPAASLPAPEVEAVASTTRAPLWTPGPRSITRPLPSLSTPARQRTRSDRRLRRAFAGHETRGALIDLAAFRRSQVGQVFLDCLPERARRDVASMSERSGMDPFEMADRMAAAEDFVVVEGRFRGVDWTRLPERRELVPEPYGEEATLYAPERGHGELLATIGDDLVVFAPNRAALEAAIDRVEGRGERASAPVPPLGSAALRGVAAAEDIVEMMPLSGDQRWAIEAMLKSSGLQLRYEARAGASLSGTLHFDAPEGSTALKLAGEALLAAADHLAGDGLEGGERAQMAKVLKRIQLDRGAAGLKLDVDLPAELLGELMGCERDTL